MKDFSQQYLESVIKLGSNYGFELTRQSSGKGNELSSYLDEMIVEIQFIGEVTGSFLLVAQEPVLRAIAEDVLSDADQKLVESFWMDFLNIAIQPALEDLSKTYRYLTITAPRIYHAPVSFPMFPQETEVISWQGQEIHLHTLLDKRTLDTMQAYLQAKEANESKSRFLANMSHDIRTPLNAVLGFSQLLEERNLDTESKSYVKRIRKSSISLLELINDILDLSKVEAGKLSLQYKSVSVKRLFEELEQVFSLKTDTARISFKTAVDTEFPEFLDLDGSRLRQILVNLLSNAFKFTEKGEIILTASWKQGKDNTGNLLFSVKDTGLGIPEDQQDVIFTAFEQVSGQDHEKYGGTGLGLAICLRLVQMMKGKIYLNSSLGEGSEFIIDLPEIEISNTEEAESVDKRQNMKISFQPAKVLIVDDMEINRKLLKAFLDQYPMEICEAVDGKDAIEKIKEFKPSLIFLDMRMPVMDGYEVIKVLSADENFKSIPVVAVTASALKEDELKLEEFCSGFLAKPLRKVDLLKQLKKFLPHNEESIVEPVLTAVSDKRTNEKLHYACNKEIAPLIKTLRENPSNVNAMIALGNSLKKISDQYPVESFISWHDKLQEACDTYDITGVSELIKSYESILKELKV
ncbi:MAG: ATP-binding protein [Lentisphaeraceae bacterium]|nr:ATP-binding protein [Lentisphaeraceae bacterium]